MYLAIIILPLLGSVVSGFFGRKSGISRAQLITCTAVVLTTIFAVFSFFEVGLNNIPVYIEVFRWIDSESLNVLWGFLYDSLTVSMLIPVLIVSSLVHIYSIGYMSHDPHIQRFFSYLSLFTFMMLILVTANNYLLMFVVLKLILLKVYATPIHLWLILLFVYYQIETITLKKVLCLTIFVLIIPLALHIIGPCLPYLLDNISFILFEFNNVVSRILVFFVSRVQQVLIKNLNIKSLRDTLTTIVIIYIIRIVLLDSLCILDIISNIFVTNNFFLLAIDFYSITLFKILYNYFGQTFVCIIKLLKLLYVYTEQMFIFIIEPLYDNRFRPIKCDSPETALKLFKELPFYSVDSNIIIEECKTTTQNKTKLDVEVEFKEFRRAIKPNEPSFIVYTDSPFPNLYDGLKSPISSFNISSEKPDFPLNSTVYGYFYSKLRAANYSYVNNDWYSNQNKKVWSTRYIEAYEHWERYINQCAYRKIECVYNNVPNNEKQKFARWYSISTCFMIKSKILESEYKLNYILFPRLELMQKFYSPGKSILTKIPVSNLSSGGIFGENVSLDVLKEERDRLVKHWSSVIDEWNNLLKQKKVIHTKDNSGSRMRIGREINRMKNLDRHIDAAEILKNVYTFSFVHDCPVTSIRRDVSNGITYSNTNQIIKEINRKEYKFLTRSKL